MFSFGKKKQRDRKVIIEEILEVSEKLIKSKSDLNTANALYHSTGEVTFTPPQYHNLKEEIKILELKLSKLENEKELAS